MTASIFSSDFKPRPFWWEAYEPRPLPEIALPGSARVVIMGAGYAGLNAALELHREGIDCIVLDANEPGYGGSSRNGGMVSGGVNVGKRYMAKALSDEEAAPFLTDAADAFGFIEDLIASHAIDCGWTRAGYFLGAWCKSHYDTMAHKADLLNQTAGSESYLVPPERQREEIGSDYYRGGLVVGRAGHLHPALFFKGLLDLCEARNIPIASRTPATRLTETPGGWRVDTPRGSIHAGDVLIATNGYTGALGYFRDALFPLHSHVLATAALTVEQRQQLGWHGLAGFADDLDRISYASMTDGGHLVFGGGSNQAYSYLFNNRTRYPGGTSARAQASLQETLRRHFPGGAELPIVRRWVGTLGMTFDRRPLIGVRGERRNIYYALGYSGHGVTLANLAGEILCDLYAGDDCRWRGLPFVQGRYTRIPPEPLRWAGYQLVTRLTGRSPRLHQPSGGSAQIKKW